MNNKIYWEKQLTNIREGKIEYDCQKKASLNLNALYYDIKFISLDGTTIHAKYIRPNHSNKVPVVFDFHKENGLSQSWFHLTRYVALGYAVIAMDSRQNIERKDNNIYYTSLYVDAFILSNIVEKMDDIDTDKMYAFGRDQGGAIALALTASNSNIKKCSMLYPKIENTYILGLAPKVKAKVLLATASLDKTVALEDYDLLFKALECDKKRIKFIKHEHELINAFEDENLKFILE